MPRGGRHERNDERPLRLVQQRVHAPEPLELAVDIPLGLGELELGLEAGLALADAAEAHVLGHDIDAAAARHVVAQVALLDPGRQVVDDDHVHGDGDDELVEPRAEVVGRGRDGELDACEQEPAG